MKSKFTNPFLLALAFLAGSQPWLRAAYIPVSPTSGSLFAFAGSSCPTGSLAAQGQTFPSDTYPTLFAAIGTTWGGSGGSFQLPDARGYFLRGLDSGAGRDPGRALASSQADAIKSHTLDAQPFQVMTTGATLGIGSSAFMTAQDVNTLTYTGGPETRPINLAILYCITL